MKETVFALSGAQVYLVEPEKETSCWLMGIHGSGRDSLSYRDVPFYAIHRDLALKSGCTFAAISMGQAVWGKPDGFSRLEELHAWMENHGYDDACAYMAASAGGCQMFRFAQMYPKKAALLIGIFPVWDLEDMAFRSRSMEKEWGQTGETLRSAVESRNPARYASQMPDRPIVICHGLEDTVVPVGQHTLKLAEHVPITLHMTREKHSTQSYGLYDTPILSHALRQYAHWKE